MKKELSDLLGKMIIDHWDTLTIEETDPSAGLKSCVISHQGCNLFEIDIKSLIDPLRNMFKETLLRKKCDKIFFITHNDINYLFLVEMKTTMDKDEAYEAKDQINASFAKLMMFFNLIENFDSNKWKYIGLIVGRKGKELITRLNDMVQISPNKISPQDDFLLRLYAGDIKEGYCNLKINDNYKFRGSFNPVNAHADSVSVSVNLTDYINR